MLASAIFSRSYRGRPGLDIAARLEQKIYGNGLIVEQFSEPDGLLCSSR